MKEKIIQTWHTLSIRIVICVMITIIPLNCLAIQSMRNMDIEMKEQSRLTLQNIISLYAANLSNIMKTADEYMYDILTQDSDGLIVAGQKDTTAYDNSRIWLTQKMNNNLPDNKSFSGYFIYLPIKDDLICAYGAGHMKQAEAMKNYMKQHMGGKNPPDIKGTWHLFYLEEIPYALRITRLGDIYYGAFLDLSVLIKAVDNSILYEDYAILLRETPLKQEKKNQVAVSVLCERSNFYLAVRLENLSVFRSAEVWKKIQIVLILLCLICAPALYWFLRKILVLPLQKLNYAHRELEEGNEDYRLKKEADIYEIQQVYNSFNKMADNMNSLKLMNMQKELEKQTLELSNLQLQIRPHFLLNTFNLMYNLASKGEMKSIQNLILYLSDYFRYLFKSNKKLELFSKELKLIEGYIDAVKLRYPGRVEIVYQIDPEIVHVRVPPLLIHNFVENIINHAMKDNETLHITLYAGYEDREVVFMISDNGIGMSAEQIKAINSRVWNGENGQHVGLANSIKRLHYFYGDEATLTAESECGAGTVFTITFPYDLEES